MSHGHAEHMSESHLVSKSHIHCPQCLICNDAPSPSRRGSDSWFGENMSDCSTPFEPVLVGSAKSITNNGPGPSLSLELKLPSTSAFFHPNHSARPRRSPACLEGYIGHFWIQPLLYCQYPKDSFTQPFDG
ncbi:hypothetical protein B0H11DRAFT_1920449 [Mycena galericulata]|nr:hypothetical protein B0H11DRAFT_1920449 [Mycena galericulata]